MWEAELKTALFAAKKAAGAIREVYAEPDLGIRIKDDASPVTKADQVSDLLIREIMTKSYPEHAILSEEAKDDLRRLSSPFVWIIDPLDGTKDFIARNDEFAINIALIHEHEPVVGVVYLPIGDVAYYAIKGEGAFRKVGEGPMARLKVNDRVNDLTVLVSRFHLQPKEKDVIKKHQDRITAIKTVGAALKGCLIAAGEAEVSYRFSSQTKEWDTAAMQLIIEEAGGLMLEPDGKRILYNRQDVYNRKGYIIANRKENILL